jgi:exosome complex component RRP41
MTDLLVACSAGFLGGSPVVDLGHREQTSGGAVLPVALLPRTDAVVLAQLDAKLPFEDLQPCLQLAIQGCHQVCAATLKNHPPPLDCYQSRVQTLLR